ncbi:MAG: N-acetyltransferase [Prevotella sp.]|nr:N-acetyltransferase [Prevotella sp.]
MSAIEIRRVATKRDLGRFIDVHYDLYSGNAYDAPNLFFDEMNTLRKDKNAAFDFCEAEYFIAYKKGKAVGRVAAIINHKANAKWGRKDVRFGWIDFIDDIHVSRALLDTVAAWGKSKGMTQIVGPLGFTDMDPEGMLIEGFDQLGTMATIYNYPYYPQHMARLGGWTKDIDYVECKLIVPVGVPKKYALAAEVVARRYGLRVKKLHSRKEVFSGGYGQKIFDLINLCYKDLYGYSELSQRQIDQYIEMYLSFVDYSIVTLIEDTTQDNKLVGIGISIPSLTRALQKCRRGRLLPFGWWHVLRAIKFHKTKIVDLLLVGIHPDYQKKGANALLFSDLIPRYIKYGWEWGETQVEMETNRDVQSMWSGLDCTHHKRRRCYKKPIE